MYLRKEEKIQPLLAARAGRVKLAECPLRALLWKWSGSSCFDAVSGSSISCSSEHSQGPWAHPEPRKENRVAKGTQCTPSSLWRCFLELLTQPVSCVWQKHSWSPVVTNCSQVPCGWGAAFVHCSLETKLILCHLLHNHNKKKIFLTPSAELLMLM